jgi:hypothetical protein
MRSTKPASFAPFATLCSALLFLVPAGFAAVTASVNSSASSWPDRPSYVVPGGSTSLTASGAATASTYQWYFNGTALPSATAATLALSGVTSAQTGNYFVRSTSAGTTTESNWLTLNVLPKPASSLADTSFKSGLDPASESYNYTTIRQFRDGSLFVEATNWATVFRSRTPYRLRADGSLIPPVAPSSAIPIDSKTVAYLEDGTTLINQWPYRISSSNQPVPGFTPLPGFDAFTEITAGALQGDDKVLIAYGPRLMRLSATGQLDPTFSYAGTALPSIADVRVDSAGRILLTGGVAGASPLKVVRLTATGALDPTFAAIPNSYSSSPFLLADGTLLISTAVGTTTRFNANGVVIENWGNPDDFGFSGYATSVVTPSGDIYLAYSTLGVLRLRGGPTPQLDPTFFAPYGEKTTLTALAVQPDGKLFVAGTFSTWDGHASNGLVRLDPSRTPPLTAPVVAVTHPPATLTSVAPPTTVLGEPSPFITIQGGTSFSEIALVVGTRPLTYTWLALDGGALPTNTTASTLTFPSFQKESFGRYQVRVTGPGGSTLSPVFELRATTAPRLSNLSSRTQVGGGEDALIAGLTLQTNSVFLRRRLLMRGAGPALAQFGVQNPLPNPVLTLIDTFGNLIERNDDWVDNSTARTYISQAGAFPFASGSRDSIVLRETQLGGYTLQLRDATGQTGVGLIECYDVGSTAEFSRTDYGELLNLSLRGKVGTGDASLIAGFIVEDPQNLGRPLRVLVRAVGPTLSQFGVTTPLANPRLTIYNGASVAVASNDDWSTGSNAPLIATTATQAGAFTLPSGSKDSAILMDLPPGAYTAIVTDVSGASGIALIELYRAK